MKLQFPVYLIGGICSGQMAWLKSKLDENEYLFVFTSAELARQFIATKITNGAEGLEAIEIAKEELGSILKRWRRFVQRVIVDVGAPAEVRLPIESALDDFDG